MIRPLEERDADAFIALRRRALADSPLVFAASPDDDFVSSPQAVRDGIARAPDWIIFGAFDPELAGTVGVMRDRHRKMSHKVHVWGMYVLPEKRRRGIASSLLTAAISHARSLDGISAIHLGVTSAGDDARRLYERAGFKVWGTQPDALRDGGQSVSEYHMVLIR